MDTWLARHRKIFIGSALGAVIAGLAMAVIFLLIRPIIVIGFREEPKEIGVTFYKSPFLDDKKVQITLDPFRSFNVYRRSFFLYEVLIKKGSIKKDETSCLLRFVNGASGRTYATYEIPEGVGSQFTAEQATQAAQRIKDAAKEQYPYFELFPYISKTIKAQYEKSLVLTIFTQGQGGDIEEKARVEIEKYLSQFNLSLEKLKEKGVVIEFKEIREANQFPLFNE